MDDCINLVISDDEEGNIIQSSTNNVSVKSQNHEHINKYKKRTLGISNKNLLIPLPKFRKIRPIKIASPINSETVGTTLKHVEQYPATTECPNTLNNATILNISIDEEIDNDPVEIKRASIITQLEELLKQMNNRIRKLEEADQSLDDMNNTSTSYILLDKYKRKYVDVWNKLCRVASHSTQPSKLFQQKITLNDGSYPQIRAKVAQYVNKTDEFPDYYDIIMIVEKCSARFKLKLSKAHMESIARDLFLEVGTKLQMRRKADFRQLFGSHLTDSLRMNEDPALHDKELQQKLAENHKISKNKIDQVIDHFANVAAAWSDSKSSESNESSDDCQDDDEKSKNKSLQNIEIISDSNLKIDAKNIDLGLKSNESSIEKSDNIAIDLTSDIYIQSNELNDEVAIVCEDTQVVSNNAGDNESKLNAIKSNNILQQPSLSVKDISINNSILMKKDLRVVLTKNICSLSEKDLPKPLVNNDLILSKCIINKINTNVRQQMESNTSINSQFNVIKDKEKNERLLKNSDNKFVKILDNFDLTALGVADDQFETELIITDLRTLATTQPTIMLPEVQQDLNEVETMKKIPQESNLAKINEDCIEKVSAVESDDRLKNDEAIYLDVFNDEDAKKENDPLILNCDVEVTFEDNLNSSNMASQILKPLESHLTNEINSKNKVSNERRKKINHTEVNNHKKKFAMGRVKYTKLVKSSKAPMHSSTNKLSLDGLKQIRSADDGCANNFQETTENYNLDNYSNCFVNTDLKSSNHEINENSSDVEIIEMSTNINFIQNSVNPIVCKSKSSIITKKKKVPTATLR